MATERLKNKSGADREVPLPDGGYVVVEANHSHEFDKDHARSLKEQTDVWEKYEAPKKPKRTKRTTTRNATTQTDDAPDAPPTEDDAPADETEQDGA